MQLGLAAGSRVMSGANQAYRVRIMFRKRGLRQSDRFER